MKKKCPKIKKKAKGYADGGAIPWLDTPEGFVAGSGRKSKGFWDDVWSTNRNILANSVDIPAAGFGLNNLADGLYSNNQNTEGQRKVGNKIADTGATIAPAIISLLYGPAAGAAVTGVQQAGKAVDKNPDNYQYKAKGGVIKGKGTGKSDSIKAKIQKGSFIVPAENAKLAEELRNKYLNGKNVPADLSQPSGQDVKVSNGEHVFTEKESNYLIGKGVDLYALAPNADENDNSFADGGEVPDLDAIIKAAQNDKAKAKTESERKIIEAKIQKLQERKVIFDKTSVALRNYLATGKETSDTEQYLGEVPKGEDPVEYRKKQYQDNLTQFNKDISSVVGNNKLPSVFGISNVSSTNSKNISAKSSGLGKIASTNNNLPTAAQTSNSQATAAILPKPVGIPNDYGAGKINVAGLVGGQAQQAQSLNGVSPNKGNGIGNFGLDTYLGLGQAALGAYALFSDGKRPVDSLSKDYTSMIDQAKAESTYGLDPALKSAYTSDVNDARLGLTAFGANTAGGDPQKAQAQARSATNQYARNLLDLTAADNQARLQKVQYRNSLINNKVERDRRLFEDKLEAFNINQKTGGDTLAAGITSLSNDAKNRRMQDTLDKIRAQNGGFMNGLGQSLIDTNY